MKRLKTTEVRILGIKIFLNRSYLWLNLSVVQRSNILDHNTNDMLVVGTLLVGNHRQHMNVDVALVYYNRRSVGRVMENLLGRPCRVMPLLKLQKRLTNRDGQFLRAVLRIGHVRSK